MSDTLAKAPEISKARTGADVLRRGTQVSRLLLDFFKHLNYRKEINLFDKRGWARRNRFLYYKYLGDYLARSLSTNQRKSAILFHYNYVGRVAQPDVLAVIKSRGLVVWCATAATHASEIRLVLADSAPMEGEWQLQYIRNGKLIYFLTFAFCELADSVGPPRVRCVIGGLQGGAGCHDEIRCAAKENFYNSPASMLIMSCRVVAERLGAETLLAVSSREHVVSRYASRHIYANYDDIWTRAGGARLSNAFYDLGRSSPQRLSDVSDSHNKRAVRKRARRVELQEMVAASLSPHPAGPLEASQNGVEDAQACAPRRPVSSTPSVSAAASSGIAPSVDPHQDGPQP